MWTRRLPTVAVVALSSVSSSHRRRRVRRRGRRRGRLRRRGRGQRRRSGSTSRHRRRRCIVEVVIVVVIVIVAVVVVVVVVVVLVVVVVVVVVVVAVAVAVEVSAESRRCCTSRSQLFLGTYHCCLDGSYLLVYQKCNFAATKSTNTKSHARESALNCGPASGAKRKLNIHKKTETLTGKRKHCWRCCDSALPAPFQPSRDDFLGWGMFCFEPTQLIPTCI